MPTGVEHTRTASETGARAEVLLRATLTAEQLETWTTKAYIEVTGGSTGTRYRVYGTSYATNIYPLDARHTVLCAHPFNAHALPLPDAILSQVLMLAHDERRVLRIAHPGPYGVTLPNGDPWPDDLPEVPVIDAQAAEDEAFAAIADA